MFRASRPRPLFRRRASRAFGPVAPLPLALGGALALVACGSGKIAEQPGPAATAEARAPADAVAVLHPTLGSEASGVVRFEAQDVGVRVISDVWDLAPGEHGYHVHVYGDCTAEDANSAGPHFDFVGDSDEPPEEIHRITGNLGDLHAGPDGHAHDEAQVELATLRGPLSIVGRAVVVHARPNDPDQPPDGAAGPRIACGVIGIAPPPETGPAPASGR